MSEHRQKGSAHVIIIIILVVALLGALGFVFWQNFMNKDATDNGTPNKTTTKSEPKLLTAQDTSLNTGYAVNYPESWKLDKQKGSDIEGKNVSYEKNIITSPSGNIAVKLDSFLNGGLGGMCQEGDSTLEYIDTATIPDRTGLRYAAVVTSAITVPGGTKYYIYNISAQLDNDITRAINTVGQNACDLNFSSLLNPVKGETTTDDGYGILATLTVTINSLQKDEHNQKDDLTVQMFKDATASDEFKQAKEIIRSLHAV